MKRRSTFTEIRRHVRKMHRLLRHARRFKKPVFPEKRTVGGFRLSFGGPVICSSFRVRGKESHAFFSGAFDKRVTAMQKAEQRKSGKLSRLIRVS